MAQKTTKTRSKNRRTGIKDIPRPAKELTTKEAKGVHGGAVPLTVDRQPAGDSEGNAAGGGSNASILDRGLLVTVGDLPVIYIGRRGTVEIP